jgi:ATP-dependent DNA helicase RecG
LIAKHTLDKFFLIDSRNVSVRSWIAREIISNSLVHREYSSAFPAKILIERDRIYAENWNKSLKPGRITPEEFTPYPKNPILARFFVNIGLADQLGSGVRNLYKYAKLYSGSEPELLEGDIFKTIIYLEKNGARKTAISPVFIWKKLVISCQGRKRHFWKSFRPTLRPTAKLTGKPQAK